MSESAKRITSEEVATKFHDQIRGKVVLITGCSPNSLGAETARAIATQNPALLILAGRNRPLTEQSEKNIKEQIPNAQTRFLMLDLASLASVRKAAAEVNSYGETVDVLINNAAIMAGPYEITEDGFESQFATNHLGHFLFTNLLLGKMARRGARIINVTSNGYGFGGIRFEDPNFEVMQLHVLHVPYFGTRKYEEYSLTVLKKEDYNKWAAYAQSKTANILFSTALTERLGGKGVFSFSAEVGGAIYTNIGKYMTQDDFALLANFPIAVLTIGEGAATQVSAAFDPSLERSNGAFLEDCKPSQVKPEWSWASGKGNADKLWTLSEEMVGQKFEY